MNLDDRVAVVTGGASGIGRAIAQALGAAGAKVAVLDRDEAGARATAETLPHGGDAFVVDLADPAAILRVRDEVVDRYGLPDVLVNAAGFDRIEPFMSNDDELWQSLTAVNYLGPVRMCHAFLEPILAADRRAKIVNISSDAGRVGSMGETVYSGTKGAVIAFTKSLAREMARHRINVNCVCPGPTDTPLFAAVPENIRTALVKAIPFRRLAEPKDIADAVLFFCSDRSDYITGQVLSVSGGLTMAG
ncbi:glucose 1-dehydrogenase [Sporichthya brevicatena]|uniref:SDR family NAD(P)-dependent oxidoreductase n=1 Tax=Sporichthya brevicatena TaxID=171442 RepID=UPI0031D75788